MHALAAWSLMRSTAHAVGAPALRGTTVEQRQEQRYPVQCPLAYSGDLIDGNGTVTNLSPSGCGIRPTKGVKAGSYLHLFLYLCAEEAPLKIELAVVRWAQASLLGLEFIRISSWQRLRLKQHLADMQSGMRITGVDWVV